LSTCFPYVSIMRPTPPVCSTDIHTSSDNPIKVCHDEILSSPTSIQQLVSLFGGNQHQVSTQRVASHRSRSSHCFIPFLPSVHTSTRAHPCKQALHGRSILQRNPAICEGPPQLANARGCHSDPQDSCCMPLHASN
jgi:hypothetical protein